MIVRTMRSRMSKRLAESKSSSSSPVLIFCSELLKMAYILVRIVHGLAVNMEGFVSVASCSEERWNGGLTMVTFLDIVLSTSSKKVLSHPCSFP